MALASLSIDLEARLAKFEEGLSKAERAASKSFAAIESRAKAMDASFAKVGASLLGALSIGALAGWADQIAGGLIAIKDASEATGASLEKVSALEDFARRIGTPFETVSGILVKFNGELSKATPGSATERTLAAIGLQAEELRRLDPSDALQKTAQALAGYADDGEKARLVQDLFGKSVKEAAPFLKELAEAGQLNAGATEAQILAADEYLKNIARLQADLTDLGRIVAAQVIPTFNKFFGELRDGIEVFGGLGDAIWAIGWGTSPFDSLGEQITGVSGKIADLRREMAITKDRIDNPNVAGRLLGTEGLKVYLADLEKALADEQKLLSYLQRRQAATAPQASYSNEGGQPPGLPRIKVPQTPSKATGSRTGPKSEDPLGVFIEDLEAWQRMAAKLDAEYEREAAKRQAELERRAAQFKDYGEQLTRSTMDINASLIADDRERGLVQIELDRQVMQQRLDNLQLYGKAREELQAKLDANILARQRALDEQLKPSWQRMLEAWGDTTRLMADTYETLMDGMVERTEEALTKFVRTGKLSVADLADFIQETIARAIAQAATAKLFQLADVVFGGGLGGSLAKGGIVSGGEIQPFANGGVVGSPTYFPMTRGRVGLMGEAGPEAIMPLRRGRDGKLGVQASAQPAAPQITINVASGVSRAELAAMLPMLTAQIKGELMNSMRRPGGAL